MWRGGVLEREWKGGSSGLVYGREWSKEEGESESSVPYPTHPPYLLEPMDHVAIGSSHQACATLCAFINIVMLL